MFGVFFCQTLSHFYDSMAGFVIHKTHSVNIASSGASVICGLGCLIMTNTLSILVHSVCISSGNKIRRWRVHVDSL